MIIIYLLVFLICVLVSVAFLTLLERKLLRLIGLRLGPNKISFMGLFQPITDAIKLSNKQINSLSRFFIFFYYISSSLIFFFRLFLWFCYWLNPFFININLRVVIFMLILSFISLNSIFCGWRTFGKYTLLGSLRTVAQLISYESTLYFCLFFFIFFSESLNFHSMNFSSISRIFFLLPFCFYLWLPRILCELNRTPFDFSEGERELVRGFNTDLGSCSFTLIFLSEYSNIIFFSILSSFFFFQNFIFIFSLIFIIFIIWIRSVLPRFRFDKLINLAWTFFIPFLTVYFLSYLMFLC